MFLYENWTKWLNFKISLIQSLETRAFDVKLQDEAFNLFEDSSHTLGDTAEAGLVRSLTLAKRNLGVGVKQKY